jgi:glycosyltransferase involved in cell wall biosynthesis
MLKIAYAHDGTNVYDQFFLDHLTQKCKVYFVTFNSNPKFVSAKSIMSQIPEPFGMNTDASGLLEGLRMYLFCFLRAFLLRWYLSRIKPRVILGNMATKYGFYTALSGVRPFILIVWGSDVLVAPKRFFVLRFVAQFALRKADAVIVDSDVQEKAVLELGCHPKKILKFPWFNLNSVLVNVSSNEVREQLRLGLNPIVISVRKHEPIYGIEYLIDAVPKVVKKMPECRFLVVGHGSLSNKLQQKVKELAIEEYVKFVGEVERERLLAYLNAADVYVSTSFSDGTSASLLEAMALGVPSIVTDIPGNREWIDNGLNGLLVPVKDHGQLAEKITQLVQNKDLRQQISKNAFHTVEVRADWRKNSVRFDDLISTLASQG